MSRVLTTDFRAETIPLAAAESRPGEDTSAGPSTMDALALSQRMHRSVWTARRTIAVWFGLQHTGRVPLVECVRTGRRGRPSYRVDPLSYERWRRGLPVVAPA